MKLALTLIALILAPLCSLRAADTRNAPDWANSAPKRVIKHSNPQNGSLANAVSALQPGDKLVIAAGTYCGERMWDICVSWTAEAPIWIVAEESAQVILTRPDDKQNVLNIGQNSPVHHLCLHGVEITGNIIPGDAPKQGTTRGRGLEDFVSVRWDGEEHDATPTAEAPFDHADAKHLLEIDFTGAKRTKPLSGSLTK